MPTRHDAFARHAAYYASLAERASKGLRGPEQAECLKELDTAYANLRQALDWLAQQPDATEAEMRLAIALQPYWAIRGSFAAGRRLIERALARSPQMPSLLCGEGYFAAASLATDQGELAAARIMHERALSIREELGDRAAVAASLNGLGNVAYCAGAFAEARVFYLQALAIKAEIGAEEGKATLLRNVGLIATHEGDYDVAERYLRESLKLHEHARDTRGVAMALNNLGNVALCREDYPAAQAYYEQALHLKRELRDARGIGSSLVNLGVVARLRQQHRRAAKRFLESLELHTTLANKRAIAYSLEGLASIAVPLGRFTVAARLYAAASRLREECGAPLPSNERDEYDELLARVRTELGDEVFAAAWESGQALDSATLQRLSAAYPWPEDT